MVIQSYSDGSEFTGKHLVAAFAGAAILGTAIIVVQEKLVSRYYRKVRKSYESNTEVEK